jgi:probable HAF family extracellular repeat protein
LIAPLFLSVVTLIGFARKLAVNSWAYQGYFEIERHFCSRALLMRFLFSCAFWLGLLGMSSLDAATFQGLGDLPGGSTNSLAQGVSNNGDVVGWSMSAAGTEAFRWTADGGMVSLGDLAGGTTESRATGVSADGNTVVGSGTSASGGVSVQWTSGTGFTPNAFLGDPPANYAGGISKDGTTVVGSTDTILHSYAWTSGGGKVLLGDLPGGDDESRATSTSANGSVVVGYSKSASGIEAFRWSTGIGMVGLGDLPGGVFLSSASSISSDGLVIVGDGGSASGKEAFRWTSGTGMVGLGDLPGGIFFSHATAISGDGSIIGGFGNTAVGMEAFIWDSTNGMRLLSNVLTNDSGLDLTGWRLENVLGISDDGLKLVGYGRNPSNFTEAWIATLDAPNNVENSAIPEPSTSFSLLVLGIFSKVVSRRRTREIGIRQ